MTYFWGEKGERKGGGGAFIKTRQNSPVHLQWDDRDKPYLKKKQSTGNQSHYKYDEI